MGVVAAGLYMSSQRLAFLNSASRIKGNSVWESFVFILNGIVFMIIGLELPQIIDGIQSKGIALHTAIVYGILVTFILIAARMLSSYVALLATMIFRPGVAPHASSPRRRWLMPALLGWTGMRGVVSLAAALSIPVTLDNGAVFKHRDLILFITFIAILFTLVVQGLTLPFIIKRTHLFDELLEEGQQDAARKKMKQGLNQYIYDFIKDKYEHDVDHRSFLEKMLKQWKDRMQAVDDRLVNAESKIIFAEILERQRIYLTELNKDPDFDEEIIRQQLYQIDLEEERLKII